MGGGKLERRTFLKYLATVPFMGLAACGAKTFKPVAVPASSNLAVAPEMWGTSDLGGYMYSDKLSEQLRKSITPLQNFEERWDLAPQASEKTYKWNVFTDG